ncbi:MAG: hypothetical protein HYT10_00525, partial [Candidatus Levybacteria bacterium]|nr:hypothetical protein [Candidatus Levybacteria bacterium]
MKFFLFITIFIFLFSTAPNTFALTPTPSPKATTTPQATEEPKGINILNNLKDRIASRVAQLNLVEKRGILATVEKVTDTQITVIDKRGDIRLIDVDELTHFSSPSAKGTFGISDITKGSYLDILGLYNKQSKRLLARFVDVVSIPVYIHGAVMSQDLENFTVTVIS